MKRIKILGTGCRKCDTLAENARTAARQLGADDAIDVLGTFHDYRAITGTAVTPVVGVLRDVDLNALRVSDAEIISAARNSPPPRSPR